MTNFDKVKEQWKLDDAQSFDSQICGIIRKMRGIKKYQGTWECGSCKDCYKWLKQEHKEPILDDVEREYLSAVIKPFRNEVEWIMKYRPGYTTENEEYIGFSLPNQVIDLPHFVAGTMYKGMTAGKRYTLKELGL